LKNADNSAVFKFKAIGTPLPFGFKKENFPIPQTLTLEIKKNNSANFAINYLINDAYD
jgi:hypothetical protein